MTDAPPRASADQADVVVLGGTGFVGSALVAAARRRGLSVLALHRANYRSGLTCRWLINANGNSKKYLARNEPVEEFRLSVSSVMAALHDHRFERYLHLSTIDVYDDVADPAHNSEERVIDRSRLSNYGLHKLLAEDLVRHYAPGALIARLGGFVGPGLKKNSIYDLLTGAPLRVHPDSAYQYMDTRDAADLLLDLLASDHPPGLLNVCGEGLLSLREVAAMVPGAQLPEKSEAQRETYRVNVGRLAGLIRVPETHATVARFVGEVLAGREQLA